MDWIAVLILTVAVASIGGLALILSWAAFRPRFVMGELKRRFGLDGTRRTGLLSPTTYVLTGAIRGYPVRLEVRLPGRCVDPMVCCLEVELPRSGRAADYAMRLRQGSGFSASGALSAAHGGGVTTEGSALVFRAARHAHIDELGLHQLLPGMIGLAHLLTRPDTGAAAPVLPPAPPSSFALTTLGELALGLLAALLAVCTLAALADGEVAVALFLLPLAAGLAASAWRSVTRSLRT